MASSVVVTHFQLVHEYLTARGFKNGLQDVAKYGLLLTQVGQVIKKFEKNVSPCLAIPFYDVRGQQIPNTHFVRVLEPPPRPGTFALEVQKDRAKGFNTPDQPTRLYIPKTIDFRRLPRGTEVRIHESALKCLADVERGGIAVGMNGVWGSEATREDLETIPWMEQELRPVVVFDSNTTPGAPEYRESLELAVTRLAGFFEIAVHVHLGRRLVPAGPNGSWGYDDWCAAGGGRWDGDPLEVEANGARAAVDYLNTKICFLTNQSIVALLDNPSVTYKVGDARNVFANVLYYNQAGDPESAFKPWLGHRKRKEAKALDYRPGEKSFVKGEYLNTWRGWGCKPEGGPTGWWDDLLGAMDSPKILETALAWRLQNPMAKPSSLVNFLIGPQGCGKTTVAEIVKRIIGPWNYCSVSVEQLASQFTDYLESFLNVVDDLGKMERKYASKVNGLITAEHLLVNRKNRQPYHIENRVTWLFTSNEHDSLPMKEGDRRWHVIRMNHVGINWTAFWKAVNPSALFARLLALDVSGWDPYAPAPVTEGQKAMAEASRNPLEEFIFRELPFILEERGRRCVTATEVIELFKRQAGDISEMSAWSPKRASDVLLSQHWGKVRGGDKIKIDGQTYRFWSRDKAFLTLTPVEIADHFRSKPLWDAPKHGV